MKCIINFILQFLNFFLSDAQENVDFVARWVLEAPQNIVPESARSWLTVVGDLLGPTLEVVSLKYPLSTIVILWQHISYQISHIYLGGL